MRTSGPLANIEQSEAAITQHAAMKACIRRTSPLQTSASRSGLSVPVNSQDYLYRNMAMAEENSTMTEIAKVFTETGTPFYLDRIERHC
jgi:adenosine deaminase